MPSDRDPHTLSTTDDYPKTEDAAFQIGMVIQRRYRLSRLLGKGGWGIVWQAQDIAYEDSVQFTALKFVRLERRGRSLTTGELQEAIHHLSQEVISAKAVHHRHVCGVYGFNPGKSPFSDPEELQSPEHRPFAELEFVDGWPLADLLNLRLRLTAASAMTIATQLCEGVASIHAARAVHQDVKPDNIMLDRVAGVKIVDFGLAQPFGIHELRLGSICYASPEKLDAYMEKRHIEGKPSSDIYSVGAILFQLFTGEELHSVAGFGKSTFEAIRERQKALTDQVLRSRMHDVPKDMQDCVIRCLKLNPSERFQRAAEILNALSHAQGAPFPTAAVEFIKARNHARPVMKDEMTRASHLVFVGRTQQDLAGDLRDVVTATDALPWREIDVFFVNEYVARGLGYHDYDQKTREARRAIARVITDPRERHRFARLVTVRFYEADKHAYPYSGSMFRNGGSIDGYDVVFSTTHLPGQSHNLHNALTYRLVNGRQGNSDLIDIHGREIDRLKRASLAIGAFELSSWDVSSEAWENFVAECEPHKASMRELAKLSTPVGGYVPHDRVLYVAAGEATTCKILLDAIRPGQLTVLDSSPQMLSRIERRLSEHRAEGTSYALGTLPDLPTDESDPCFDLRGKENSFRTIVIHHSLAPITRARGEKSEEDLVLDLAKWCKHFLTDEGSVVLAAHSGEVKIETDLRNPDDPIRQAMCERSGLAYKAEDEPRRLSIGGVVNAFVQHGFHHVSACGRQGSLSVNGVEIRLLRQQFTMQNRRSLWHVPAIRETLVGRERCEDNGLLEGAGATVLDNVDVSFTREVCLFKFQLGS